MYALIVLDWDYSCGVTCGIYESLELATQVAKELLAQNEHIVSVPDREPGFSVEVVEFKLNTVYTGSLNGCAGCCSEWKYVHKDATSSSEIAAPSGGTPCPLDVGEPLPMLQDCHLASGDQSV